MFECIIDGAGTGKKGKGNIGGALSRPNSGPDSELKILISLLLAFFGYVYDSISIHATEKSELNDFK